MHRTASFVVEVVGVAGAGKTTLVDELVRRDPELQSGIRLSRAESVTAFAMEAARLGPSYVARYPGTRWFTADEARAIAYVTAWRRKLRRAKRGTLLFDHGPIFRLTQLAEFGPPVIASRVFHRWWDGELARWLRALDLVVWLDAPDDVLLRRIRSRDRSHVVRNAPDEEARAFLARYRAAYGRVVPEFSGQVSVLKFDSGERSPAEIAEHVAEAIRSPCEQSHLGGGAS